MSFFIIDYGKVYNFKAMFVINCENKTMKRFASIYGVLQHFVIKYEKVVCFGDIVGKLKACWYFIDPCYFVYRYEFDRTFQQTI